MGVKVKRKRIFLFLFCFRVEWFSVCGFGCGFFCKPKLLLGFVVYADGYAALCVVCGIVCCGGFWAGG